MVTLTHVFLEPLKQEKQPVSVFLISGIKLHGIIESFDDDAIFLHNGITQLIFKHAISTVVPVNK